MRKVIILLAAILFSATVSTAAFAQQSYNTTPKKFHRKIELENRARDFVANNEDSFTKRNDRDAARQARKSRRDQNSRKQTSNQEEARTQTSRQTSQRKGRRNQQARNNRNKPPISAAQDGLMANGVNN